MIDSFTGISTTYAIQATVRLMAWRPIWQTGFHNHQTHARKRHGTKDSLSAFKENLAVSELLRHVNRNRQMISLNAVTALTVK